MKTEMPYKRWVTEQAQRLGLKPTAIYNRICRGQMELPPTRRVNQRVIMVVVEEKGVKLDAGKSV